MADNVQTYTTRIFLNSEEAKKRLDELQQKVEDLRKKKDEAARGGDWPTFNNLKKQLDVANNEMTAMQTTAQKIDRVLGNLSTASVKDLQSTIKAINKELNSGAIERGSEEWKFLNEQLKRCKQELQDIRGESALEESMWTRLTGFLNKNWGAITQMLGAITGLSVTIRKVVADFASMEEAMADTRKYTGLSDVAIRELNEDLKKIDTRTGREELNELAGAAGRLGKTSKQDILDFVEAGNMIKVALGDDLGEGAIDKVGKLAMAFGEDERMGLRGAMLATGSAVNELAQNSSAQAGYLVEFTARVAGFGKQLGLTQAQIMGFATVMDENLLQDEMAATAFGNMLTKMQTDTAKFAKIAGMDIKAFTDLLNKDANAAILALADSLKKADPQNMMKMLDDMGLDGSRAVAVLATMSDKIDDVRKHQELATTAYQEAISIEKEYATMNNTVEAEIDKCKKKFSEMSVELGEKLMPVVKYTISTTSVLVKALSGILGFAFDNIGAISKLAVALAEYVAIQKIHYLWTQRGVAVTAVLNALNKADAILTGVRTKLLRALVIARMANNGAITKTIALQRILNTLFASNPIGAVVTVVAALTLGLWKLVEGLQRTSKEKKIVNDIYDTAAEKIAEEKSEINKLLRVARDEREELGKRKEAIEKLNRIIPGYNGQLDETTGKYTENAIALKNYNSLLREKYRLEAAEDKLKELERERFKKELEYEKKLQESYDREESNKGTAILDQGLNGSGFMSQGQKYSEENFREHLQEEYKKENEQLQKQMDIVTGIRDASKEVVDFQRQMNQHLENQRKQLEGGDGKEEKKNTSPTAPYKSEAERKKEEEERKKREAEEKQRLKEAEDAAKAASDAKIATLTHEYAMGEIAYRQYIQKLADLQTEGLRNRRDVYAKGSAEYERLNRQVEERIFKGDQQVNRMKLEDLRRCMQQQQVEIEAQADRGVITEAERLERQRTLEEAYLSDVVELYKEGSLERMRAEWELQEVEQRNKLERERYYQQQLDEVRDQYLGMSNERQMQIAMKGLDDLHDRGLLKEKEYRAALAALQAQYADSQTTTERNQKVGSDMLRVASDAARKELDGRQGSNMPFVSDIMQYQTTMEKLKQLYGNDKENHDAYLAAKQQATSQFCANLASQLQAAYNTVNQVMSAASSYFSAQQEYETAQVKKKYEKQIEAAGSNQRKVKKLQEKQQKEEAAIKTKYAKRAAAIQMAQAVAQTAISAINAYSSAAAIPVVGHILAPIAAAMAIAAGMLQIATIKKQQQVQEAGYYEGGFTGGRRYRREAGVVHEGEFVANHQAVNNPNILPFLNFIDQAQRNNTVGSLSMQDVSRSMGAGGTTQLVTPVVNVQNNNEELSRGLGEVHDVIQDLRDTIAEGIQIDYDEFDKNHKHHQKMKSR